MRGGSGQISTCRLSARSREGLKRSGIEWFFYLAVGMVNVSRGFQGYWVWMRLVAPLWRGRSRVRGCVVRGKAVWRGGWGFCYCGRCCGVGDLVDGVHLGAMDVGVF